MKKIFYFLSLIIFSYSANAFIFTTKNTVSIKTVQYDVLKNIEAIKPLPAIRTFDVSIIPAPNVNILPMPSLSNDIQLLGWQQQHGNSSYLFEIYVDNIRMDEPELLHRSKVIEDTIISGSDTTFINDTLHYYKYKLRFAAKAKVIALGLHNEILWQSQLPGFATEMETKEYESQRMAKRYLEEEQLPFIAESMQNYYQQSIYGAGQLLKDYYDIGVREELLFLKEMKNKKHALYDEIKNNTALIGNQIANFIPESQSDESLQNALIPAIQYFKNLENSIISTKRKQRKIKYIALYNLCQIYIYLREPEQARIYANKLYDNKFHKRDYESLDKAISRMTIIDNAKNGLEY